MDTPDSLAADMLKAAAEAIVGTRAIVQASAKTIKDQAKKNVRTSAPIHSAHAAEFITYETEIGKTSITAEIGYDKDKGASNGKKGPGSIGNLLEYGSDKNPAHRDLGRAMDVEEPLFEQALSTFAGKLL